MIAVAKGLLSGLETAVASAPKKDGNTPPFADLFQQVSGSQTRQAAKIVAQRTARAERDSTGGKEAGGSSPAVDSAKQDVRASVGGSASAAKVDGKTSASAGAVVVAQFTEDAKEGPVPVADGRGTGVAEAVDEQGGGDGEHQAKTGQAAEAQALTGWTVAQSAGGTEKDGAVLPALPGDDEGSQSVRTFADSSVKGGVSDQESQRTNGLAVSFPPTDISIGPRSSSQAVGSATSALIPLPQQTGGSNSLPSVPIAPAAKQTGLTPKPGAVVVSPSIAPEPSGAGVNEVLQTAYADSTRNNGQTSTPVLLASVRAADVVPSWTIAGPGASSSDAVAPLVLGTQAATSDLGHPGAPAGSVPVPRAPGALQAFVSGQTSKAASGSASTKVLSRNAEDKVAGQVLNTGESTATSNQGRQGFSLEPAATALSAPPASQVVIAKLETNESTNYSTQGQLRVDGATSSGALQAKAAPTFEAPRVAGKNTQVKTSAAAASPLAAAPTIAVAVDTPARLVAGLPSADPLAADPLPNGLNVHASASIPVTPLTASIVPDGKPGSTVPQEVTSSAVVNSSAANNVAPLAKAVIYVTPVVPEGTAAPRLIKASAASSDGPVDVESSEGAEGGAVQGTGLTATALPSVPDNRTGIAGGGESINQEQVVAAANALSRSGQQRAVVSGSTPVVKERRAVVAESKSLAAPASSTPVEAAGTILSVTNASAASTSTRPASREHQAMATSGAPSTVATVGNVEGTGLSAQSQGTAFVGSTAPSAAHVSSTSVGSEVGVVGSNGAGATAGAISQGADHPLSPLAHTTLSATPTVLEVGVPGGNQGWLKIRAEIGEGGVVQASMSASTHAGQDALRRDLPAMTAFLESEHVPVNLQVTHGMSVSAGSLADANGLLKDAGLSLGSSLGQSLNQNANSSAGSGQGNTAGTVGGGSSDGGQQREASGRGSTSGAEQVSVHVAADRAELDWSTPIGYGSGSAANGGSWLNVIA